MEMRRLAAEKRTKNSTLKPCPSCGKTDHSRKTSSLCDNYVARRSDRTLFTRKSTIKSSMQSCFNNTILVQILQDTVKKCRNLCCVASLFMNYLKLHRLRDNQPIPVINQDFVYAVFCQIIDRGSTAEQWIKDMFQEFRPLLNQQLQPLLYRHTAMITTFAREYATNFANHISTNFERRTTDYFFVRFNDESDDWFLGGVSVASRRKFALYAYNKAATGEGNWPTIRGNPLEQALIDNFVSTIDLGPTPVTIQSLEAHGNQYLPWLYQVLQRLESRVIIQEPVPQDFASKSFVHRKLKEVSET